MTSKIFNKLSWEKLATVYGTDVQIRTNRLKIPNGWIFSQTYTYKDNLTASTCFIPDPNHEWGKDFIPMRSNDNSLKSLKKKQKLGTLTEEEKIDLEALLIANA